MGVCLGEGDYYSFRAEYQKDVDIFLNAIKRHNSRYHGSKEAGMAIFATTEFPERHVELKTHLDIETLRGLLREIPDSYLMLETLRPGGMFDGNLPRYYQG